MSEKTVLSQLVNLSSYLFWLVPLWPGFNYFFMEVPKNPDLFHERIIEEKGVFVELELFRVKDITLHQSFWYRLLGISNIHLRTSDKTSPLVTLYKE